MRVLVADDFDIVRRGIRALLEASGGYEICAETANGRSAVELAEQEKPDVAILGDSMTDLNGIDAARQISKVSPNSQILIFTRHDEEDLVREALQAGARAFLLKSEADEHLLYALAALGMNRTYFSARVSDAMVTSFLERQSSSPMLTRREREVVQLIAEGHNAKDIAARLGLSVKTVETHRSSAIRKLGVKNVAGLVLYAVRHRLVKS